MDIIIRPSDTQQQRELLKAVYSRLTAMKPKKRYTLAEITGDDYWDSTKGYHQSDGHCFAGLVRQGRVPFIEAGWVSCRHNAYRYTGWDYSLPGVPEPKLIYLDTEEE